MKVLSLFDGISCGRVALERAGIKVSAYYASEIHKPAIKIAQKNYPDTVHVGSVVDVRVKDLPFVPDMVIAGSPCQGFSFAGDQLAFEDPRSKLYFEFLRIWNELRDVNPNALFFLENVRMKEEFERVISEHVGFYPHIINSALFSAQNRERLYWTNIPVDARIKDRRVYLKDILIDPNSITVIKSYDELEERPEKSQCLDANYHKGPDNRGQRTLIFDPIRLTLTPEKTEKIIRHQIDGKRVIDNGDGTFLINGHLIKVGEKTGDFVFGVSAPEWVVKQQNGVRFNASGKQFTLTCTNGGHGVFMDGYIRKLHPIECERLQGLPDNYTEGVSDTQRYHALGNGWQVDTVAHLLSGIGKGRRSPNFVKHLELNFDLFS